MAPKSQHFSQTLIDAEDVLRSYLTHLRTGITHKVLETTQAVTASDVRQVKRNVEGYAQRFRELTQREDFESLPSSLKNDVRDYADECEASAAEADEIAAPAVIFAKMDVVKQHDATARHIIEPNARGRLKDRLHLNLKRPDNDPAGNGNTTGKPK